MKYYLAVSIMVCACLLALPGCSAKPSNSWPDIPSYPGAVQKSLRTWVVVPEEAPDWEEVEWRYYTAGDSWQKVNDYYQGEFSRHGWKTFNYDTMPAGLSEVIGTFYLKISRYEDMRLIETWSLFNKGEDWAIVWVGAQVSSNTATATAPENNPSSPSFATVLRTSKITPGNK